MKIFVSGATGFIGSRLTLRLAREGHTVHALYRQESKLQVINHPGIMPFKGDILNITSLDKAIAGCEIVYHTAAFASVWTPDPSVIYRLNIEGAMNIINSGIKAGVRKFVCTSTAGVYGPSGKNGMNDENSSKPNKYFIDYEASKSVLEEVLRTLSVSGVNIVTVNPTRVYGPGILSESNGVTRMVKSFVEGKWRFIPGNGESTGNYVYVEDVVSGHILAMEKGRNGENYILGGSNVSYNEFFRVLGRITGTKHRMFHIPQSLMMMLSGIMLSLAKITGKDPIITPPLVKRFVHFWNVSSAKAIKQLGYDPVSLEQGLLNTVEWIKNTDQSQK